MDHLRNYGNPNLGKGIGYNDGDVAGRAGDNSYASLFGDDLTYDQVFGPGRDSRFGEMTGNDGPSPSMEDLNNNSVEMALPTSQGQSGLSNASNNNTTASISQPLLHLPTTPDPLDVSLAQKDGLTSGQHVVCTLPPTDRPPHPLAESEAAREAAEKEKEDRELEAMMEQQLLQDQLRQGQLLQDQLLQERLPRGWINPTSDHDRHSEQVGVTTDTTPSGTTPSGTTPSGTTPSGTTSSGTTSGTSPSNTTPSDTTPISACKTPFELHNLLLDHGRHAGQPVNAYTGQVSRLHNDPNLAGIGPLPPEHSSAQDIATPTMNKHLGEMANNCSSGFGPSITGQGMITLADLKGCASPHAATRRDVKLDRQIHDEKETVQKIVPYITFSRGGRDSEYLGRLELSGDQAKDLTKEVKAYLAMPENAYLRDAIPNAGTPDGKMALLKSAFHLLKAKGWGPRYFGCHNRAGEKPRERCWPDDSTAIIFNFTQFLYKRVYLEKSRLIAKNKAAYAKLGKALYQSQGMEMGGGSIQHPVSMGSVSMQSMGEIGGASMQYQVSMDGGSMQHSVSMGGASMPSLVLIGSRPIQYAVPKGEVGSALMQYQVPTGGASTQFPISTESGSRQFPIDLCNEGQ